jgi:hypothetical protein
MIDTSFSIPTSGPTPEAASARSDAAERFQAVLGRARRGPQDPETARDAATELVAIALVQPVFDQLAEQPFAAPPFAPGTGERKFFPLLARHLAHELTVAGRYDFVDAVADRLQPTLDVTA